jgi:hypothetical protein
MAHEINFISNGLCKVQEGRGMTSSLWLILEKDNESCLIAKVATTFVGQEVRRYIFREELSPDQFRATLMSRSWKSEQSTSSD